MPDPIVIIGQDLLEGVHNAGGKDTQKRLREGKAYKDLSTVCVIPTRGQIPAAVVENWMNLMMPMNQKYVRIFVSGMEVGDAYQTAVQTIKDHPQLNGFKYMLTLEEDNIPPPDGLLKLYENICTCKKVCHNHNSIVAGLYFTKGEGGQPMIYGDPNGLLSFQPRLPKPEQVQECNGTGMGFTLFHMDLFNQIESPWFKTVQQYDPQLGSAAGTQDLYFMGNVRKKGYKIASDNRVKVGHYDYETGICW